MSLWSRCADIWESMKRRSLCFGEEKKIARSVRYQRQAKIEAMLKQTLTCYKNLDDGNRSTLGATRV